MYLIKSHIKILKYIFHHPYVEYSRIKVHFKKLYNFESLFEELRRSDYILPVDGNYNNYGEWLPPDSSPYLLTELGLSTCESHKIFTLSFIVKDIVLPIIIAIITTLITIFLTS